MKHSNTCTHKRNCQHNSDKNGPATLQVMFCQLKNFLNSCLKVSLIFTKDFNGISLKTSLKVTGLVHSKDSKPKNNRLQE